MVGTLLSAFRRLAPWSNAQDFLETDWLPYMDAAKLVQNSEHDEVEIALGRFLDEADGFTGVDNETRLFLLVRVVFVLPDGAPVDQRRVFKGWANWPAADAGGNVNLSWPVDWQAGRPVLLARFEGADGPRYAAVEEYRYFLTRFPFRKLRTVGG
jgi:hypothetical protein